MVSRQYGPNKAMPAKPVFSELQLNKEEMAEIEFRFEALMPYLKPDPPRFGDFRHGEGWACGLRQSAPAFQGR
jgi:hypothetical protein